MAVELGTGWKFPLAIENGGLKTEAEFEHLRQSYALILMTRLGERIHRPWFGSDLYKYIDMPINFRNIAQLRLAVYNALREEPRGTIQKILITTDEANPQWLYINTLILVDQEVTIAVQIAYNRDVQRWEALNVTDYRTSSVG